MSTGRAVGSAQRTVRRLITYALLFALVVTAAVGLSGLAGRLVAAGTELAAGDVAGLARSLAFALIGGPLAAVLWWVVWRRLGEAAERASVGWGLYLAGACALALIIASSNLLGAFAALIGGESLQWRMSIATGLVWAAIWVWHRWMSRHARKRPTHLADVPAVVGSYYGLVLGVGGAVTALSALLDAALRGAALVAVVGAPWWVPALQSLVWAAGGGLVWWWHWQHDGGQRLRTGLANVALILVGVLGAGIIALGGAGVLLFVLLRLAFDRTDPTAVLLEPLAPAIAAAAIGSLVWIYHRGLALGRADSTRLGGKLVTSGVALAAAAAGVGVIVNAVLAMAATPLTGSGVRTLLLGGISSLVVGGPAWWIAWKPLSWKSAADGSAAGGYAANGSGAGGSAAIGSAAGPGARRVYLIVVFGLSAVVAVITLLVIGFRMFEYLLADATGGILVERIRAPLGLLVATGLAAGYHFAVWRYHRAVPAAAGPARKRTIGHIILVSGPDPAPFQRAIEEATGAVVTVWRRADATATAAADADADADAADAATDAGPGLTADAAATDAVPGPAAAASAEAAKAAGRLAAALEGVTGKRVLVMLGPDGRIDVVPLLG